MYGTAERVRRAKRAARRFIRRAAVRRLGALCGALALGLTGALALFTDRAPGMAQGACGAVLLFGGAGGYVLVGTGAFTAAAAMTVVWMRLHQRGRQGDPRKKTEPPPAEP